MKSIDKSNRSKLVEECFKGLDLENPTKEKCEKMETSEDFCTVYPFPGMMWRHKKFCPMATHAKFVGMTEKEKIRVGQQKQKKKI